MQKISKRLVAILGALTAFGSLSIDMYLPSFPTLEKEFQTSSATVQLSLAAFFIGLALGQAIYGPLADRYGRKRPLYAGIVLYVVASLGCALAPNITVLIGWRFVQALGGCAGLVIARAMVRDLFDHQTSAKVLSLLVLVLGAAPILAPSLGGYLLHHSGWRAMFWLLAAFGVACLCAAIFGLRETLPVAARQRHAQPLRTALRTYSALLRDRRFNGYALTGAIAQAGLFAYISNSPFVFIKLYGISEQRFGMLFGLTAFGLILASQLNHRALAHWKSDEILQLVAALLASCGALLLLLAWTGWGGVWGVWLPVAMYVALLGFSFPNTIAGAMAHQAERAGSASALLGTMQFALATLAGALVGAFHDHSAVPLATVIASTGALALLLHRVMIMPMVRERGMVELEDDADLQIVD